MDKATLQAALAIVSKQIRGLQDLANTSLSADLLTLIRAALTARQRRRVLINNVIASIDAQAALTADGYPALDPVEIPAPLFTELQDELASVGAAAGIFDKSDIASQILVSLGQPEDKPE